jgi:hypothetical protein
MHDALKNSIEKVFTTEGKIGPNNRITDFGWESTEVTLIALYNYLISTNDWPFVKKYINDISPGFQLVNIRKRSKFAACNQQCSIRAEPDGVIHAAVEF